MRRYVYLVKMSDDNLMDYEDNYVYTFVMKIFDDRQKAVDFISAWKPELEEGEIMIDNPEKIKTEGGLDVTWETTAIRHIYTELDKYHRALITFTIEKREVE